MPVVGPIYAAVNLLQKLDVPLRPALIADLATEMESSRAYHLLAGFFHWIVWYKLDMSPLLDWYRDPQRRRRGLALSGVLGLLILYILTYLALRFVPIMTQFNFINTLAAQLWLQLLCLSPVLLLLIPLAFSLVLRGYRQRQRNSVQIALNSLLATEIPLRGDVLRPYEGQFEGNGSSRAWSPTFFAGQGGTNAFRHMVTLRLATSIGAGLRNCVP